MEVIKMFSFLIKKLENHQSKYKPVMLTAQRWDTLIHKTQLNNFDK
jgi:hypothetical protein